ncbi:hypothetical protein A2Y85_04240 [candidate division WOR-3 bacterium RBG_13_43_14]|uniref:Phosphatidylglycerol lysyltransferase C-terminal domain-containing protein n=1 Tax=candidate division WOR-3 bacterium RBG_13_43_14 TaxID=1802590 RepID=A0A1F4UAV6_UNCW3|nr:MAG: hypothetical protein A2Y85_04240 [candidate division WOR-3 bacterium RBG_13_43_14]
MVPVFPHFKSIEINDQIYIREILWRYQPKSSELNFSNLYIWRGRYQYFWSMDNDNLVIISDQGSDSFALQPVGNGDLIGTTAKLFDWMKSSKKINKPCIERADQRFTKILNGDFTINEKRDHFDYIYKRSSLVELSGNRYHNKRNHISALKRDHQVEYREFDASLLKDCNELIERWCGLRRCEDDMNLLSEWDAVAVAMANVNELKLQGGVLLIDGKVEAFTLGEMLNLDTLVIHIEKANPEIQGSYATINQKFAETMTEAIFINREQDLGEFGLRQSKMSYYPSDLVKKYTIFLKNKQNTL